MTSISDAKAWRAAATLSENDGKAVDAEIAAAEEDDKQLATMSAEWSRTRSLEAGVQGYELAVQTTSDAQALANDIRSGRVPAKEARQRYDELATNLGRAAAQRSTFETLTTTVAEIDEDPLAWAERLRQKFPSTAHRFTFLQESR